MFKLWQMNAVLNNPAIILNVTRNSYNAIAVHGFNSEKT